MAFLLYGGLAEQVAVDEDKILRIPDFVDHYSASALLVTYGTSLHALKDRAKLQSGETVLVLGAAGGVGIAAIQLAKAMGARVRVPQKYYASIFLFPTRCHIRIFVSPLPLSSWGTNRSSQRLPPRRSWSYVEQTVPMFSSITSHKT